MPYFLSHDLVKYIVWAESALLFSYSTTNIVISQNNEFMKDSAMLHA